MDYEKRFVKKSGIFVTCGKCLEKAFIRENLTYFCKPCGIEYAQKVEKKKCRR